MPEIKDYIQNLPNAERRYINAVGQNGADMKVELRAAEGKPSAYVGATITGYASLFNVPADLWFYTEVISPGAFDEVLMDDVRCLFNHDPNYVLARSVMGKGTLTLSVDKKGLMYTYNTPDYSYAIDLAKAIEAGDISQSSFAFSVKEEAWTYAQGEEKDLRIIKKIEVLYDVSPVTYPAYTDTTVAKRNLEGAKKTDIPPDFTQRDLTEKELNIKLNRSK